MVEEVEQPWENPEIKKLFGILMDSVLEESGRGALLIATSHVDTYLTDLINSALPKEYSNNQRDKLFKYPGPVSSLSSKIELSYAFRLIDKRLYDNLSALRKLRNDAAHSAVKFELHELEEKLRDIYSMGDGFAYVIREMSVSALMNTKLHNVKPILDESGMTDEEKQNRLKEIFSDPKHLKMFEQQVPFWEMVIGLCLLCWLIIRAKQKLSALADTRVWSDLVKDPNKVEKHPPD